MSLQNQNGLKVESKIIIMELIFRGCFYSCQLQAIWHRTTFYKPYHFWGNRWTNQMDEFLLMWVRCQAIKVRVIGSQVKAINTSNGRNLPECPTLIFEFCWTWGLKVRSKVQLTTSLKCWVNGYVKYEQIWECLLIVTRNSARPLSFWRCCWKQ